MSLTSDTWSGFVQYSKANRLSKPLYHYVKNLIHINNIHQELACEILNPEIVLVYQMAKVGSSSITRTIKANGVRPVYQIHSLNRQYIENLWKDIKLYNSYFGRDVIDHDIIISRYLSKRTHKLLGKRKIKIITSVRDPIARNISHFFQGIEKYFPNFVQSAEVGSLDLKEVIQSFWKHQGHRLDYHWKWFEREFKAVLGIDIFSVNFSPEKGYKIEKFGDKNIELLILKLESFDQSLEISLKDFFGLDALRLKEGNISNKKPYNFVYKNFLEEVKFPQSYVDRIYDHQFMKHFYTASEIEKFKCRWLK